jgi:hypothetical protein
MAMFDWFSKKVDNQPSSQTLNNQIATNYDDGAINLENSVNNFILNFDWAANNQFELIDKYREIANYNEVDYAIEDIVNEMVSFAEDEAPVKLNLDDMEMSDNVKQKIHDAWGKISNLLNLKETIHQRARNFYIDGRMAYQKVADQNRPKQGLLNIVELDPRYVTKVRNVNYNQQSNTIASIDEYFIYDEKVSMLGTDQQKTNSQLNQRQFKQALKLDPASVAYVTSGLVDSKTGYAVSWLHKAVKPANQLRMMENALVIYRITRAPERRVFYIDVGNLPKSKAEQYLNNLKNSYRNRMSYDPENGSFKDARHLMTMQEDFWLPRTTSGKGTEISTLPGGANLDSIEDVVYFLKRLYKALNLPVSRLEQDSMMSIAGRAPEISRDELKFSKFVSKVRKRFNMVFKDLLRTELVLTNVIKDDEWDEVNQRIKFIYAQDMYLEERKYFEMMRDRLDLLKDVEPYLGKYFSHEWARTTILRQSDEDMSAEDKIINKELSIKQYQPDDEESPGFGN